MEKTRREKSLARKRIFCIAKIHAGRLCMNAAKYPEKRPRFCTTHWLDYLERKRKK